jgi:two-component system, NtrC family, response regulator AtoC
MLMPFIFGNHRVMKDLERRVGSIARSRLPVLIEGASGAGKEALAELLHNISGMGAEFTRILCRKTGPMVYSAPSIVNGGGDLGAIYLAARGTVFLKNIHLLAPAEQEQLLAALEQAADSADGKDEPVVAARLVSSATEPLEPFVSRGELNPALYHRLSVYRICLPPLRERREDIPELFDHMVRRAANGGAPSSATPSMLDVLMDYDWPGNLRELQNIARTYVVSAQAEEIIAELSNRSRLTPVALQADRDGRPLKEQVKGASRKLETEIILRTLERHHWNRRRAAQTLQISYRSLLYKMKSCNLRVQRQTAAEGK